LAWSSNGAGDSMIFNLLLKGVLAAGGPVGPATAVIGQPWFQQYDFNTAQSAPITSWATETSLPVPMETTGVATPNRVFTIGGLNSGGSIATVYSAPINGDGTLGAWANSNNDIPFGTAVGDAFATSSRVYYIRGTTVYSAPINGDGTLGAWTTPANTPIGRPGAAMIITSTRVYLLGGSAGGQHTTVQSAPINPDGTIGVWSTSGNSLPIASTLGKGFTTNGRAFYLAWQAEDAGPSVVVYTAVINGDGTLGSWSNANRNLPQERYYSSVVLSNNRVYLLGGRAGNVNGFVYQQTVFSAPINGDGTLGAWATDANLPGILAYSTPVITNSRVYLIGGRTSNSNRVATIYSAPWSGGFNDYSQVTTYIS
jgi:hypothetical protein